MNDQIRARMVLHGSIVVMLGLLVAVPYTFQMWGLLPDNPDGERAWRMAHLEGLLNGMLVIAVGAVGQFLLLSEKLQRVTAACLIFTAYGNVIASSLAAAFWVRGLTPQGPLVNQLTFTIYVVAIGLIYLGMALVIVGAWRYVAKSRQA